MTTQKRIAFQVNFKTVSINLPDETNVQVLWVRGKYLLLHDE